MHRATLRAMDESAEREAVDKWLASTGHPVESAVARALESAGFEVDLGRLYRDPDTGVTREIDVVARTGLMYDAVVAEYELSAAVGEYLYRPRATG